MTGDVSDFRARSATSTGSRLNAAPERDTGLHHEERGSGFPLLLLHAGVADSRMWDEQSQVLASHYRVIRFDLRGFGRSPVPPRSCAHYEDAMALLDQLGHPRAFLVGASFGGTVAMDAALAYPERVAGLVLAAPALGGYEPSSEALLSFFAREERALERGDLDGATEIDLEMWVDGHGGSPARVPAVLRERVRVMQREAFAVPRPQGASQSPLERPALGRLREIRARTLVMVGALDVPEFRDIADTVARGIPGARKIVVPEVAHLLSMEKPAWFSETVLRFLAGLT